MFFNIFLNIPNSLPVRKRILLGHYVFLKLYNTIKLDKCAYRYFAITTMSSVNIYSFDCKLVSSPKWPNMQCDMIQINHLSMSDHMLAVRDQLNDKSNFSYFLLHIASSMLIKYDKVSLFLYGIVLHVFEILPLNTLPVIKHGFSITDVQLMTTKSHEKRYLALIDSSMNIFIVHIGHKDISKIYKLGK